MNVIFSSIEANQTSESAGDPPPTYCSHVSTPISRGRWNRNGKKVEQVSTLLRCLQWLAGWSTPVEMKCFHQRIQCRR